MENDSSYLHGSLQQLLEKVEPTAKMIPKLQASHAPMCKLFTAYYVISGIRHVVPLVTVRPAAALYVRFCQGTRNASRFRVSALERTACTTLDESHIVYGGEGNSLFESRERSLCKVPP